MSNLAKRAMLAQPNISIWTARRYDRDASEEVAKAHNADAAKAGRYNKCLIDVSAPEYTRVVSVGGEARRWHESHTLPWAQDGARILSSAMFQEYQREMTGFREKFSHSVTELVREYPRLVEEQKTIINGLYKADDYPRQSELEHKFGFRVSIFPVPVAGDFRAELDADDVEMIRAKIEQEVSDTVKDAERERWERLMRVVAHAVNRLEDVKGKRQIFRDTLIENIKEAVDVLPKLALHDDPAFDSVLLEVKEKLCVLEPGELREKPHVRRAARRDAEAIIKKMSAFMPK